MPSPGELVSDALVAELLHQHAHDRRREQQPGADRPPVRSPHDERTQPGAGAQAGRRRRQQIDGRDEVASAHLLRDPQQANTGGCGECSIEVDGDVVVIKSSDSAVLIVTGGDDECRIDLCTASGEGSGGGDAGDDGGDGDEDDESECGGRGHRGR